MRIALFGATGKIGRHVLEQALAAGHEAHCLARDLGKLPATPGKLKAVQGDVLDAARVDEVVRGCDAAISALGPRPGEKDVELLARAATVILGSMRRHGVRKFVGISGAGIKVEGDVRSPGDKFMASMVRLLARKVVLAKELELEAVKAGAVQWVMVRPPFVVEGPCTGAYRVDAHRIAGRPRVQRGDIAHFMLRCAAEDDFVGLAPFIFT